MTVKSACIIAGLICGTAGVICTRLAGSALAAIPFVLLCIAAAAIAAIMKEPPK